MKSKVTVLFIACALLMGTLLVLVNGPAAEEKPEPTVAPTAEVVTMNGRMIDLCHFMTGKRAETKDKLTSFFYPVALDTDKKVYVILWNHEQAKTLKLKTHVGFDVEVTGRVFEKKGLPTLQVEAIQRLNRG